MTRAVRVAVIGAGASGMAATHYLLNSGYEVDVYDKGSTLGGRIGVEDFFGRELCFGGKNIGRKYSRFREFLQQHGDPQFEEFGINTSRETGKRARVLDGKSLKSVVDTLSASVTPRDAWRLVRLALRHKRDHSLGQAGSRYYDKLSSDNDEPLLSQFFQPRTLENLIRPATVRMNGAEPDEVFLETFGTNLHMLLDQYDQLTSGFSGVFSSLQSRCNVRMAAVTKMERLDTTWGVESQSNKGIHRAEYQQVFVCLPARNAAQLLKPVSQELSDTLNEVRYYPVATIIAQYSADVFSPSRRAVIFPSGQLVSNAGAYGKKDLDLIRYTISGRTARDSLKETPDSWLQAGESQLRDTGILGSQKCVRWKHRIFDPGLCAYAPHQSTFVERIRRLQKPIAGLHLSGDYIMGSSLENCFRSSFIATGAVNAVSEISDNDIRAIQ